MRGGTELCIRLDNLVNSINEISLGGNLAPCADGKHSGLSADAMYISTYNKQPDIAIPYSFLAALWETCLAEMKT